MRELVHVHGVGDFLIVESLWTDQERAELETIYYCAASADVMIELLQAAPNFQHVKHVKLKEIPKGIPKTYWLQGVMHLREFVGSSFLKYQLANISQFNLPNKYHVIHAATPFNSEGVRQLRDMKYSEWEILIVELKKRNSIGVAINSEICEVPSSEQLLDLQGKTTLPEAIEILKKANGYFGIDSNLSVLAAQLFSNSELMIRTKNPRILQLAKYYYRSNQEINFLYPDFHSLPYEVQMHEQPQDKVISPKTNILIGTHNYEAGDWIAVEEEKAKTLIELNQAEPVLETKVRGVPRIAARKIGHTSD